MVSRLKSGFTLVELLTVLAILAVIAAISYPVFLNSRKSALTTVTDSNLRQVWLALQLYRADYEATAKDTGSSSEMGFPNRDQAARLLTDMDLDWRQVRWREGRQVFLGPIYYPFDESDISPNNPVQMRQWLQEWLRHSNERQGNAVLLADFNRTEGCRVYDYLTCMLSGRGITLNGDLIQKRATGTYALPAWWE
jgi:prepilin-type N-terminal cleavage/methylation domain-containing protein